MNRETCDEFPLALRQRSTRARRKVERRIMPSIRPQYVTFGTLINKRLFRIPEYQRAYSWESQQRRDLFDDINNTHSKISFEHYMATVVTLSRTTRLIGTDEHQIAEVVDGQQRITTLILLLKAIEKALESSDRLEARMANELADLLVKPETDALLCFRQIMTQAIILRTTFERAHSQRATRLKLWQIESLSARCTNVKILS
jgi:hypothetical protein